MSQISYKDFRDKLRGEIWPPVPGEARNLRPVHDKFFIEGMCEAGKWVRCLHQNNVSVYPFCSTYVECAKSIVEAPVGRIKKLYTIANTEWCDKVIYSQWTYDDVECWAYDLLECWTTPSNAGYPALRHGIRYAESSTDIVSGRARIGSWAIHNSRLYIVPWIQSNESIVVEWDGYKRVWGDDDLVDTDIWDTAVEEFLKLFVRAKHEDQFGVDPKKLQQLKFDRDEKLADIIHDCEKRLRVEETHVCEQPRSPTDTEIADDVSDVETVSYTLANISDMQAGGVGNGMEDVADLVKSWDPDFIFTNGDNQYANPPDYAASAVGLYYDDYVTDNVNTNRFWPAMGNHDYDSVNGDYSEFMAYFTLTNNERYYDFTFGDGLIHMLFYNSDNHEPDGYIAGSKQAEWLELKLRLSTARWKIVVLHHGPYTSQAAPKFPGYTDFRFPYLTWGADILFNGHFHAYERFEVDGFPYIVNGCASSNLDVGDIEPTPNALDAYVQVAPITVSGACKLTVSHDELKVEFIDTAGTILDTLTLTKT